MHSGGFLDGFIDEFHETFDFRDGGRSIAPRNQIDYLVQIDGQVYANFQDSKTRVGDLRGWLGYQLYDAPHRSLALRGQLKLPTGSVRSLSGSGAADLASWLEYGEHSLLETYGVGINLMLGPPTWAKGFSAATTRIYRWLCSVGFVLPVEPLVATACTAGGANQNYRR